MTKQVLDKKSITKIRQMIVTWGGKLTWESLVVAIKSDLGVKISRQSLQGYNIIYTEYSRKKDLIRGVINVSDNSLTVADSTTIKKLEKDLASFKAEAEMYKRDYEQAQLLINRVIVNAQSIPNLDVTALFADIDSVNDN
jgi:hypothetical protein